MKTKTVLQRTFRVIADEAERNPRFEAELRNALGLESGESPASNSVGKSEPSQKRRGRNRRDPAVLDPIELAGQGEESLRNELGKLDIEQLKDIVADYGMDPGKLVMKWKSSERIVNHIVEYALARAKKGDAFRS